ncbi:DUF748 domain-containing protein [Thauera humireducens]|uniref:DUF748 domain-containing protein n=1 Tax=Thauera humireducens TaxID=1134435 RepID=UPI00311EDC7B
MAGGNSWSDVAERIAALADSGGEDDAEAGKPGTLFSVGNIRVAGGRVSVEDKPRGLKHELADLEVGVPFVSNLPVKVDVFVEPTLSAVLDGNPLKMSARTKPFQDFQHARDHPRRRARQVRPHVLAGLCPVRASLPPAVGAAHDEHRGNLPAAGRRCARAGPARALRLDQFLLQDKAGEPVATVLGSNSSSPMFNH